MYKKIVFSLLAFSSLLGAQTDHPLRNSLRTTIFESIDPERGERYYLNTEAAFIDFSQDVSHGISEASLKGIFLTAPYQRGISASQLEGSLKGQISPNLLVRGKLKKIFNRGLGSNSMIYGAVSDLEARGNMFYKKHTLGLGVGTNNVNGHFAFPTPTASYRYAFHDRLVWNIEFTHSLYSELAYTSADDKFSTRLRAGKDSLLQIYENLCFLKQHELEIEYHIGKNLSLTIASGVSDLDQVIANDGSILGHITDHDTIKNVIGFAHLLHASITISGCW